MTDGEAPDPSVGRRAADTHHSHATGAAFRGFMFSDLRGYTSFIERAGNRAAAELLDDYQALVRAAIARHGGREVSTEGDSLFVVFPSASSAVMCGLAIVDAAKEASDGRPDRPINVGIGVHAGEAVETAGTFIGAAVNLAARVCAAAAAGEVLVTGTVRGMTQASIRVGFVPRGRRRLKGITDRVDLFAVIPSGTTVTTRRARPARPAWAVVVGALVVVGVVGFGAILAARPPAINGPTASAQPSIAARSAAIGSMPIGNYVADGFQPPFTFLIDNPGWTADRISAETFGLLREDDPRGRVDVGRIATVLTDACIADGPTEPAGSLPIDLVSALETITFITVGETSPVSVGGASGLAADVTVIEGALAACGSFGDGDVALFPIGEELWRAQAGERFRLRAVDVGGQTVSFLISSDASPAGSLIEQEEFFSFGERVVRSVDF